jgi:uncharacterized LabA/DUF88 family protein
MERVVGYIDGFNLYHGLRSKNWKRFYWLNIQLMARFLLKPDQALVNTKYFTSIVSQPVDKHRRQAVFLEALQTLNDLEIYYGHYLSETIVCRKCGHTYVTHHEKMTDVNISMELMTDAHQDNFDAALLVSADSDLLGPVQAVQRLFPHKRVIVAFPPARNSNALMQAATGYLRVGRDVVAKSVFADQVSTPRGFLIQRPSEWQ